MFHYQLNGDSNVPIYRQLADLIHAQIHSGVLKNGTQLPTVREMAEKSRLSPGTVKRAYDYLQETGDIEMTRRRGTFVKYVHRDRDSRKHQAMVAIDQMIKKMTDLSFSPAEIQIFLNLKMREWGMKWTGVRLTVVTEYPELSCALKKQLETMPNVQCTVYPLRQLQEYPYSVDEQSDVILSSAEDESKVTHLLPDKGKFVRGAMAPDAAGVVDMALSGGENMGVLCESDAFFRLVKNGLPQSQKLTMITEENWNVSGITSLIIAQDYREKCSALCREKIDAFSKEKRVFSFACRLDAGSIMYLEERIGKMRDEKQQWPAAIRL